MHKVSSMNALAVIERAVRANFMIDGHGTKPLMASWYYESKCRGIARMVFTGVALEMGFKQWDIRTYLKMTSWEFEYQATRYKMFVKKGEPLFEEIKMGLANYDDKMYSDLALRIYRKSLLVKAYVSRN